MLRRLLPHAAIILCAMYFVFFFIDRVNSAMSFINNGITKRLLVALCVICVIESIWLIRDERRRVRQQQLRAQAARKRREQERRQRRPIGDYPRYSGY